RFETYAQRPDPLGVLAPAVKSYQTAWVRAWVHTNANDVRLDVLPEKFYVDHWLAHWTSHLVRATPSQVKFVPLLDRSAALKHLELTPGARDSERVHREVLQRTTPELLSVPLLNDCWTVAAQQES